MLSAKRVNEWKHHLLVNPSGLVLTVVVHAADVQDREGAKFILEKVSLIRA